MRLLVSKFLKNFSTFLEFFIAIMLGVGVLLLSVRLAASIIHIPYFDQWPNYEDLLETCFNLIIGVELIRMIYRHTPDTIFEVLIFAIARQIIIDHSSIWGSLIGVVAIAILFATRKYLFTEFDVKVEMVFRASTKVRTVNRILGTKILHDPGQTILDILNEKFEEYNIEAGVGASVYFGDIGLRIDKMHGEEISRIEVIHAIH